jgi:hypothetical protein
MGRSGPGPAMAGGGYAGFSGRGGLSLIVNVGFGRF